MTPITNPTKITWINPKSARDANGNEVAWDPAAELAGIDIQIDGADAVDVPVALGATSFDLTALDAFKALADGDHTVDMAVTTKEGAVGLFSSTVTFSRNNAVVPLAPTGVALA